MKAEVFYWKVDKPEVFSSGNFPTFWNSPPAVVEGRPTLFYGLPVHEYPGLIKVKHGSANRSERE